MRTKAQELIRLPTGEVMTLAAALDSGRVILRESVNAKTGNIGYVAWVVGGDQGWDVGKTLYLSRQGVKPF